MTPKQDVATPTRPGPAKPVRRRWTVSPVQEPADAVEPAEPSEAAEAAEVAETAADTVEAPAVVAPVSERRTGRWVAAA
ncbi:MAG: hypothetical protein HOY71_50125, partial [Nonomuraea sp.]|nr:hypothetical protein [Nonomuraea sp.]